MELLDPTKRCDDEVGSDHGRVCNENTMAVVAGVCCWVASNDICGKDNTITTGFQAWVELEKVEKARDKV